MKENEVLIKISGKKTAVETALKAVENAFPLALPGKILNNDKDDGVHVFVNACAAGRA